MDRTYSGKERRKFKRLKLKFTITVIFRKDEPLGVRIRNGKKEYEATMLDISEGGMSILTDINIPPSTILWIRFTLAHGDKERIDFFGTMEIKGEVRYSSLAKPGFYRLGICFLDISENERNQITNFMAVVEK